MRPCRLLELTPLYFTFLLISFAADLTAEMAEVIVLSNRDLSGQLAVIKPLEQVDPAHMQSFGITTADLISSLPGVALNGQGGSLQSYSLRGMSGARIQTRLAGVPLATERRAGNSASFIDPFLIDTVEVVKGPVSTLFGSGALGGLVLLQEKSFQGPVASVGLYSEGNQSLLGAGWGNSNVSLGMAYRKQGQSHDSRNRELNDGLERGSAILTFKKPITDDLKSSALLLAARGTDIGKSSADYPFSRITNYPREDHLIGSWTLTHARGWSLGGYVHDQRLDTDVLQPGKRFNETSAESLDYGGNWMYQWQTADITYRAGVDWDRRTRVRVDERVYDYTGNLVADFTSLEGEQDTRAVFIDGQWTGDNLILQVGLRANQVKQKGRDSWMTDQQWTGVAGAKYQLSEAWQMFAELSSGFRFPELTEKFFNGTTGRGVVIGFEDLQAETSLGQELGLVWQQGDVSIQGSVFTTRVNDYIERVAISERVLSYRNVEDGQIDGIELAMEYHGSGWSLHTNGHWLNGEDDQGNYLADISAPRVIVNLVRHTAWAEFSIDYRHRFATDRVQVNELPPGGFDRLSIGVAIPFGHGLEVKLWADNLLDDSYRLTADDLSPQSTRRGLGVSLSWHG